MKPSKDLQCKLVTGLSLAMALLAGCTVGPRYHAPAPPTVATYTPEPQPKETVGASGWAGSPQHLSQSADIPAQWWTLFHSQGLDAMVREALDSSPTLAQATARLKEAQEESNARTGATKYPSVSANVSAEREQLDLAVYGIPFPSPPPFNLLNGSVAVSYALDLFGANRRLVEGLNAQVAYESLAAASGTTYAGGKCGVCRYSSGAVAVTNRHHTADARASQEGAEHRGAAI